ncbi:thiamine-binding protein [Rhodohalobacter sp. SW132]|uniref:YkoF family thiamine/hydroxymethylpyrimidine-binding protein n=1 Tax=Rhodohalobacter sp. SW132 TaxID=2293433 RepID=UPI000E246532|nr:YkoF family thiamine/hydroxymethylpyrimidine-binding protein [Rhodohalobacter sp. SW132]REL25035.1 thiamine-binding protein [Rhodohalobacter sp. SW132]
MSANTSEEQRIAGCSFSVYPMSDRFSNLILDALKATDSSKVWMKTDKVSTIARGRIPHIFDVSQAVFLHIAKTGVHTVYSATFSVGCPGDTAGHSYMAKDEKPMNHNSISSIKKDVTAKFALYPMGGGNYMDLIYEQIEAMKKHGVEVTPTHYETILAGSAQDVFSGLEKVLRATEEAGSKHTIMTVTISANSPSGDEVEI